MSGSAVLALRLGLSESSQVFARALVGRGLPGGWGLSRDGGAGEGIFC
jgi:hypothetical protein